jgi:DNA-directed RNA polymerase subunit M/transcription elongation factor TFIIS
MVVCPQCFVKHDDGEEFCKKCGSFLLPVEDSVPEEDNPRVNFLCHRCQILYKKGNYCPTCGSLLMRRTVNQDAGVPFEKKSVIKSSREWARLLDEEKELESCMTNLEAQRDKISGDVFNSLFLRYKERLESLSPLHREIETELESIRKRASEEIEDLEKELKPVQERLEEFRSLNKSGAVSRPDFLREKRELKKEIKSRERELKRYRQILSLLPEKMGGRMTSSGLPGLLFRPFPALAASAIVILMAAGAYLLWFHPEPFNRTIPGKEKSALPSASSSANRFAGVPSGQEGEKIGSLFENIRQANLQKNIELFVSCFSRDFSGMEGKRRETLKMWENYNYLNLSYHLKKQAVSGDTANVTLEWLVRTSQKTGGPPQEGRTVLEVTLKREEGLWKIKEIKPLS